MFKKIQYKIIWLSKVDGNYNFFFGGGEGGGGFSILHLLAFNQILRPKQIIDVPFTVLKETGKSSKL